MHYALQESGCFYLHMAKNLNNLMICLGKHVKESCKTKSNSEIIDDAKK